MTKIPAGRRRYVWDKALNCLRPIEMTSKCAFLPYQEGVKSDWDNSDVQWYPCSSIEFTPSPRLAWEEAISIVRCPACGSFEVDGCVKNPENEEPKLPYWVDMTCTSCGHTWRGMKER